ncbi:hypothetical protein BDZ91DRAFT_718221 [Kalaharituber pfeilii]|nr:hypothetical protein BDZ91DRAFT_718221 [Kalaharituber pfeilii]
MTQQRRQDRALSATFFQRARHLTSFDTIRRRRHQTGQTAGPACLPAPAPSCARRRRPLLPPRESRLQALHLPSARNCRGLFDSGHPAHFPPNTALHSLRSFRPPVLLYLPVSGVSLPFFFPFFSS